MKGLFHRFRFAPDSELTIECNPDDITDTKANLFRDLGFNRVSLGVQSFNDRELRLLERRHDRRQAERAFNSLLRAGFYNMGIDLMYGLPEQTESHWLNTLRRAIELAPAHLSCYQLTIAKGTPFARRCEAGLLSTLEEDKACAFFLLTSELLASKGYIHYEISNFSKEDRYMSRHNRKYWHRVPYLGLGPSAHSFAEGNRWWNVRSIGDYCDHLVKGRTPVESSEQLSPDQEYLEWLFLGLRTKEGLDMSLFQDHLRASKTLKELLDSGLVTCQNRRIIPTPEGFLVADSLPLLFCH